MMSENEQKYWSSFEISKCNLDTNDHNFSLFLERTYDGQWVKYENPIEEISSILKKFNEKFGIKPLFKKLQNIHLNMPVVNTRKAFSDSCSELYKLVGPDNMEQNILESHMIRFLSFKSQDFIHQSGRNLSILQLFKLIEDKLCNNSKYFDITNEIKELMRIIE